MKKKSLLSFTLIIIFLLALVTMLTSIKSYSQGVFGGKVAVLGQNGQSTYFNTNSQTCDGSGTGNLSSSNPPAYTAYLGDKFYMGGNVLTFNFNTNYGAFLQWRFYVVGGSAPSYGTALNFSGGTFTSGVCSGSNNIKIEQVPISGSNAIQCTSVGNYRLDANLVGYNNGTNYTAFLSGNYYIPFTVNALGDPTSCTASISGTTANLSWSRFTGSNSATYGGSNVTYNTMIVRYAAGATPTLPTNGSSYSLNASIGSGTVVYASGAGGSTTDNSISSCTNYDYYFYSENYTYYSSGIKVSATQLPTITSVTSSVPSNSTTQTYKGATITIAGCALNGGTPDVKLGGSGGTTISSPTISATQIQFTVPDATSSGTIYVSNGTNNFTSSNSLTNLGYITTSGGLWSNFSTWLGGITSADVPNSATAIVTIANNVTLDNNESVKNITINSSGGSFNNGSSQTLNISSGGTLTNNGTFTGNNGTVSFSGTGTVNGTVAFNNLTIAGGLTLSTNVTVNGNLQINTGGSISSNSPIFGSSSTLTYNTGGTYNISNEWTGGNSNSITAGTGVPNNVTISSSTNVAIQGANGRGLAGNLQVDNLSTLTLGNAIGGDIYLGGNYTQNGTLTNNGRAFFFTKQSGPQTLTGSSTLQIPYLVFSNSGSRTVQLSGVDLNCAATNGGNAISFGSSGNDILDLNGQTLSLGTAGQSCTISGTGKFRGNTSSNISLNGTGTLGTLYFDQTTLGTTNALNNLTINLTSSGSVTLGNALNLSGVLTPTAGVLTTGGFLTLTSTTITGGGAIGQGSTSGGYISGNVTIQRYTQAQRGYRTIANPFTIGQSLNQLTKTIRVTGLTTAKGTGTFADSTGNPSVFWYDPTKPAGQSVVLQPMTSATDTSHWRKGNALYVFIRGNGTEGMGGPGVGNYTNGTISPVTLSMSSGTINQGSVPVSLTYGSGTSDNYNLIGNPYPCPINLKNVTGISSFGTVYVYDPIGNSGLSSPYSIRGGFHSYSSNSDIIIPSLGGFYIKATATGQTITFNETDKATVNPTGYSGYTTFGVGTPTPRIRLGISTVNGNVDDLKFGFDANSTSLANDFYDAPKLSNSLFDFYSLSSDNQRLAIDYRSATNMDSVIPLGIQTGAANTYSISLSEISNLPNTQVVLRDKLLKTENILSQVGDSYSFDITADTATKGDNRFEIGLLGTTVLPVTIADITAQLQTNKTVAVSWTSATELNLAYYNVQRSVDGSNFSTVGKVAATGAGNYRYSDDLSSIIPQPATVYYRLQSVDKNASSAYSKVVSCQLLNAGKQALSIYPNPVQATLFAQLTVTKAGSVEITVRDLQGKLLSKQITQVAAGTTAVSVNTASLASGSYVLVVNGTDGSQQQQFVKE
jgi:hypothetical protein